MIDAKLYVYVNTLTHLHHMLTLHSLFLYAKLRLLSSPKAMKKNTTIQELCVGEQKIDIRPFLGSKRITDTLNYLDLGGCKLMTAGAKQMAAFVKSNPPLMQLNLEKNGIPSSTDTLWGEALKANTNLQHLNLHGNYFNDKVSRSLGSSILQVMFYTSQYLFSTFSFPSPFPHGKMY